MTLGCIAFIGYFVVFALGYVIGFTEAKENPEKKLNDVIEEVT